MIAELDLRSIPEDKKKYKKELFDGVSVQMISR